MPTPGTTLARTSSAIAVAARRGNDAEMEAARRDHTAAKLEAYIERTVAAAPPLTASQIDRIVTVLRGAPRAGRPV